MFFIREIHFLFIFLFIYYEDRRKSYFLEYIWFIVKKQLYEILLRIVKERLHSPVSL